MPLKITTWNINSARLRIDLIKEVVHEIKPDILCLQETKATDSDFPTNGFSNMGFSYQYFRGEKGYNGVATLSKIPLGEKGFASWADKNDCRHIFSDIQSSPLSGVRLHNFYIPAGGEFADEETNPKFAHKMNFLRDLTQNFKRVAPQKRILVGDLNIAPLPEDVWNHKKLLDVVSHTPQEVAAMDALMEEGQWIDAVRVLRPAPEVLFSWWSYRSRDWREGNRGRRLDHIWVTPDLVDQISDVEIFTQARGMVKPSDHVPLSVTFK